MKKSLLLASGFCSALLVAKAGYSQEFDPIRLTACGEEANACAAGVCESCLKSTQKSLPSNEAFSKLLNFSTMLLNCSMDHPLRFSANTPNVDVAEQKFQITLCGHVCDGDTCYEVSDSSEPGSSIHVESITVQDAAPPMPMLKLTRAPKTTEDAKGLVTAEVTLSEPQAATAKSLAVENAELKVRVDALEREIELRAEHDAEIRELTAANTQLAIQVAELTAVQEPLHAMMNLMNEKNQLFAELQATRELLRRDASPANFSFTAVPQATDLNTLVQGLQQEFVTALSEANAVNKNVQVPVPFAVSTSVPVSEQLPAKCACETTCATESKTCGCETKCACETKTCECSGDGKPCATCVANGKTDAQTTTK